MISKTNQANSKGINTMPSSDKKEQMAIDRPSFRVKLLRFFERIGYRRENSVLGLDIGNWAIKLVELCYTKQGWKLLDADMEMVSDSPLEDLKRILQRRKSKTDKVISAISPDSVIEHTVELPQVKEKELRQMLNWEVRKSIDSPPQEIVWDYFQIGESKEEKQLRIFLAISQKKAIKKQLNLIQSCGLKVLAFETKPLALYHILRLAEPSFHQNSLMLVDLGLDSSHLIMAKEGILSMSRSIGFGGKQITTTLSNILGCGTGEVEKLKANVNIYEEAESGTVNINRIIQNQLDNLLMEIQRSSDFFLTENPKSKINKIILAGGTAKLGSLDRYLKERLNIEVGLFDPSEFIQLDQYQGERQKLERLWPHLAVALGLATWREK